VNYEKLGRLVEAAVERQHANDALLSAMANGVPLSPAETLYDKVAALTAEIERLKSELDGVETILAQLRKGVDV
jgi:uncharacterized small protein (DUF1192 family)